MTRLTRLRLKDFRNYRDLDLALDGRHVCLHGPNGAGKTNLIEAISQLSPGRGLRTQTLVSLTRHGADGGWTVFASAVAHGSGMGQARAGEGSGVGAAGVHAGSGRGIGVGLEMGEAGPRRVLRLDGANAGAGDLSELVRVVWLTPAMDGVFRGGAGDRRRFFDRHVMAHIPVHGPVSAAYEKAVRERNALMEQGSPDPVWLDALEARAGETGGLIAWHREQVLCAISEAIDARPDDAFPKAVLRLEGEGGASGPEALARAGEGPERIGQALREALRAGRARDRAAGRTLSGPHRADLRVVHAPSGLEAGECSTGQQKALLTGLVLASASALSASGRGPAPLLLLDEAGAHLDGDRRAALFDALDATGGQAWLTGTDAELFDAFGTRAQRFAVAAGEVFQEA